MEFVIAVADGLNCRVNRSDQILWHYTRGESLCKILESGTLHATHTSCLNDASEVIYANTMLGNAFAAMAINSTDSPSIGQFKQLLKEKSSEYKVAASERQAKGQWFVASFSGVPNDLSQWRAYCRPDDGYAIGLSAKGLSNYATHDWLRRVNYKEEEQVNAAHYVAEETILRYQNWINANPEPTPELCIEPFLKSWAQSLDFLAPLLKHPKFACEDEYRIVTRARENKQLVIPKATILTRRLELTFANKMLPIKHIQIGPGRNQRANQQAVQALLKIKGYGDSDDLTSCSEIPFQDI